MTTGQLESFETITWANHAEKSLKHLYEFYRSRALCDVTLIAQDGTTFKAHQILLAVHSSLFHWVFHGWRETDERVTEFKTDIEAEVLEALLCLIYQGEVKVPLQGPWRHKILQVAGTLQFTGVVEVLAEAGVSTGEGGTMNGEGRVSTADETVRSGVIEELRSVNEDVGTHSLDKEIRPCSVNEEIRPCSVNEEIRPCSVNEEIRPDSMNEEIRPCSLSGEDKSCSINDGKSRCLNEEDSSYSIHKADDRIDSINEGRSFTVLETETARLKDDGDVPCPMNIDASPQFSNSGEKTLCQNSVVRSVMDEEVRPIVNEVMPCMNEEVRYSNNECERSVYSSEERSGYPTEEEKSDQTEDMQYDQTEFSSYFKSQKQHLPRAGIARSLQDEIMESQEQGWNSRQKESKDQFESNDQLQMSCSETSRVPLVHGGSSQTRNLNNSQTVQCTSVPGVPQLQSGANNDFVRLPFQRVSGSGASLGDTDQEILPSSASNSSVHQPGTLSEVDCKVSSILSDINDLKYMNDTLQKSKKNAPLYKVKGKRSRKGVKKEKSTEGSLKCTECGSVFSLRKTLKFHLMQVHRLTAEQIKCNPELLIQCEVNGCHFASIDYVEVERHAKSYHPDVKHTCFECLRPRTFHLVAMLMRHQSKVHGAPETHRCSECGESFTKLVYLQEHERNTHGVQHSVKLFRCEVEGCGYETVREVLLQKHQQVGHRQHKCPHCNTVVKTNNTLQTHIRTMHLNIRPFLCDVCGVGFSKEPILRQHFKTKHSDSKEYMCQLCPYATNIQWYLANHVFHRHGIRANFDRRKELKCPDCSLKFLTKSYLQKHIRNVHDDTFKWTCDVCGKTYKSFSAMSTHRKVHLDQESKCPYCEYSSKTGEHMKLHIRTQHTFKGVKPYSCPYCSYCSAMGGNVRKHVMQKHPGEEVRYDTNKEQILHMQLVEAQMERGGGNGAAHLKLNT